MIDGPINANRMRFPEFLCFIVTPRPVVGIREPATAEKIMGVELAEELFIADRIRAVVHLDEGEQVLVLARETEVLRRLRGLFLLRRVSSAF